MPLLQPKPIIQIKSKIYKVLIYWLGTGIVFKKKNDKPLGCLDKNRCFAQGSPDLL